jgi:hypothetical protein
MSSIGPDKLRYEIQNILKDADLNTLSSKKVRQMLEEIFKCDFTDRKKEIDDILMSEITTRDIQPIVPNVQPSRMDEFTSDEDSQGKRITSQSDDSNQQMSKSDEEVAMEIHQQENRPSLRAESTVSSSKNILLKNNKQNSFKTSSTSTTPYKKPTTSSLKVERRRTCYNKELDISDQLAVVVGGHRVFIQLILFFFYSFFLFRCLDQKLLSACGFILKNIIYWIQLINNGLIVMIHLQNYLVCLVKIFENNYFYF